MMRNQSGNRTCFALLADRLSSNYLLLDPEIPYVVTGDETPAVSLQL